MKVIIEIGENDTSEAVSAFSDKIVDFAEAHERWLGSRFWSQHELFP